MDMNTLPCVKHTASGKLLYSTQSSDWCSVVTQMGGIRGGVCVRGKPKREEGRGICSSAWCSVVTQMGGIRGGVCMYTLHIPDSLRCREETKTQNCKAIILQLKKKEEAAGKV